MSSSAPQTSSLLSLPPEIRAQIWSHTLSLLPTQFLPHDPPAYNTTMKYCTTEAELGNRLEIGEGCVYFYTGHPEIVPLVKRGTCSDEGKDGDVGDNGGKTGSSRERYYFMGQPAISRVCKALRDETLAVYYGGNGFILQLSNVMPREVKEGRNGEEIGWKTNDDAETVVRWIVNGIAGRIGCLRDVRVEEHSVPFLWERLTALGVSEEAMSVYQDVDQWCLG